MKRIKPVITLGFLAMILTIGISVQLKTVKSADLSGNIQLTDSNLKKSVLQWKSTYNDGLKKLSDTETQLEELRNIVANLDEDQQSQNKMQEYQAILGLTDVTGEGVVITVADNNDEKNEDSFSSINMANYLVHDGNLVAIINELKAGLTQVKTGLTKLSAGTDSLTSGVTQIKGGTALLAEKTGELSQGANTIYQGTTKLAQATSTLKDGSSQMKDGLNTLDNSSAQLLQANTQLTEGAQTINDGATTLADGIATFNEEGIQKICNFVNGDLKDLTTRAEKLTDLAKSYNSFTMVEDGVESNSKFVMIIDAVKKQEATSKQEYIVEDNNKQN